MRSWPNSMGNDAAITGALAVMTAHIEALNAHDEAALARTLHFPQVRLNGAEMKIWETPETYFSDFQARAGSDWRRSDFEDIQVLRSSTDKVHLDAKIIRYDAQDEIISSFRSLWVITLADDRWAAKLRSSFATT